MTALKVPFLDLKIQYQNIKPEIDAAVAKVLESGQFVLGGEVWRLRRNSHAYCGAKDSHCREFRHQCPAFCLAGRRESGPETEVIYRTIHFL